MLIAGHFGLYVQFPGGKTARRSHGRVHELVGRDHLVHQAPHVRLFRLDGLARGDHFQGIAHADQAGQPLGAAAARDKADLHFGLAQVDAFHRHPVMAAHGNLQAAAKAVAVDGRHHRFGSGLDAAQEARHLEGRTENLLLGLYTQNLGDVRAGNEVLAGTRNHNGLDGIILPRFGKSPGQLLDKMIGKLVHRRVVHGKHPHPILDLHMNGFKVRFHGLLLLNKFSCLKSIIEKHT